MDSYDFLTRSGEANDLDRTQKSVQDAKDEQEKGARILDILKKSLKAPEEKTDEDGSVKGEKGSSDSPDSSSETASASGENDRTDEGLTTTADEKESENFDIDPTTARGEGLIEKNRRLLKDMGERASDQDRYARECNSLMDDAFLDVSNTLSSDEASAEDKLNAYGSYQEEMQHIYADKLDAVASAWFDHSSQTMGSIEMNAHDDLAEVIRDFINQNGKKGINMAKDFLTKNPFE